MIARRHDLVGGFARRAAQKSAPEDSGEGMHVYLSHDTSVLTAYRTLQEHHAQAVHHVLFNNVDAGSGNLFATVGSNQARGGKSRCSRLAAPDCEPVVRRPPCTTTHTSARTWLLWSSL